MNSEERTKLWGWKLVVGVWTLLHSTCNFYYFLNTPHGPPLQCLCPHCILGQLSDLTLSSTCWPSSIIFQQAGVKGTLGRLVGVFEVRFLFSTQMSITKQTLTRKASACSKHSVYWFLNPSNGDQRYKVQFCEFLLGLLLLELPGDVFTCSGFVTSAWSHER